MAEYNVVEIEASLHENIIDADVTISNSVVTIDANVGTHITHSDLPSYDGPYEVTPDWEATTLATKNKKVERDITVVAIPFESVSNLAGGRTVYIGGIT